ncbi:MAG TPA: branched-chain amino acid transaminase [Blastocatellia bacterium]|nr:branched-chain amino acid transaminase [Blastocatellia bacterium]
MTFDKTNLVWMNGELTPWNGATVHVSAHALHYGSGVFEGMRCYETKTGPAVFRMDQHLERLFLSASWYGIRIPYSKDKLADAVCATILGNGFSSCYVRPICYYGSSSLAVHPLNCPVEVVILAWPWGAYLGEESVERGVRVTVASWAKFHSRMLPTTAKGCGGYLNSMLAAREAAAAGYDEALLLDESGHIAEGSGENLFLVRDGRLLTNDESSSILLGITRDSVIDIARDLGYEVEVGRLTLDDLRSADEAFFTGTAVEVTPIRELDGTQIGAGRRGVVTQRIQQVFADATAGRDSRYASWLHQVADKPAAVVV